MRTSLLKSGRPLVDRMAGAYVEPSGVKALAPVQQQVFNARFFQGRHRLHQGGTAGLARASEDLRLAAKKVVPTASTGRRAEEPTAADAAVALTPASDGKVPRTARGQKTLRKILDAARLEFGTRGFSESSIVGITMRARVALGTFYTYFDSKDAVFSALVDDMSDRVREAVASEIAAATGALEIEAQALRAYLRFAADNKEVYRIIDEAEFVDPAGFRAHYVASVERIAARLTRGVGAGELKDADALEHEVRAWAVMGVNVFLGLRFGVWGNEDPVQVARYANALLSDGIRA